MQLSLIDPRLHPVYTKLMDDDLRLRDAITFVRSITGSSASRFDWPFVEHICDLDGRPAWAVDDNGHRYVVIGHIIFRPEDMDIADEKIRTAAHECFGRLDACATSS